MNLRYVECVTSLVSSESHNVRLASAKSSPDGHDCPLTRRRRLYKIRDSADLSGMLFDNLVW